MGLGGRPGEVQEYIESTILLHSYDGDRRRLLPRYKVQSVMKHLHGSSTKLVLLYLYT
jgi:hypothetical protein